MNLLYTEIYKEMKHRDMHVTWAFLSHFVLFVLLAFMFHVYTCMSPLITLNR
jgi:hypothetical protein